MTKDEALRLALEALKDLGMKHYESTGEILYKETYAAIKAALEPNEFNPDWDTQAVLVEEIQRMAKRIEELEAKDEPVAWYDSVSGWTDFHSFKPTRKPSSPSAEWLPLYATPPQRKPLTDEEILHIVSTHISEISPSYPLDNSDWINFSHAIEAAHGIKGEA